MDFNVGVRNPYAVPIKSPSFDYQVDVKDTQLLKSSAQTSVDLPARQVGNVVLPVRMSYEKLLSVAEGLRGAKEVPYTLKGTVQLPVLGKKWKLPLEHSGNVPVPHPPKFTKPTARVGERTLTSAEIIVESEMTNPNVFPIGLHEMGYDVQIGGIRLADVKVDAAREIAAGASEKVTLKATASGIQALQQLLKGKRPGKPSIKPTGYLKTPYGKLRLSDSAADN